MTTLSGASANQLAVANPWSMVPPLGNLDAYISAANRLPLLTLEEEQGFARKSARPQRPRSRRCADPVAPAPRRLDFPPIPGLRPAARRPDPGRQRRPDEGREALRPRPGRAAGQLRHALDQGRDPRVHPEELAHGQGRDDQGPAQAVLQPALDEAGLQGRFGRRRRRHAPRHAEPGRSLADGDPAEREARRSAGDGNAPVRRRRAARPEPVGRRRRRLRPDRLPGRRHAGADRPARIAAARPAVDRRHLDRPAKRWTIAAAASWKSAGSRSTTTARAA